MESLPSLEYRLAKLLSDYFTHVQQQNSLPPELNIGIGLEVNPRTRPCAVFHIDTLEFPHSKLVEAEGQMILFTHADQTSVLQEALWIAALRSALSSLDGFFAWLAALPEDQRIGWRIRRLRITRSETDLNREERCRTHTTRFLFSAQTAELTPAS